MSRIPVLHEYHPFPKHIVNLRPPPTLPLLAYPPSKATIFSLYLAINNLIFSSISQPLYYYLEME